MPSPVRLALAPAVVLVAVLGPGPAAWGGTLPCDDYSQACESPSPTASPTSGAGGGGALPEPTLSPAPGGDGGGGVDVPTPAPTQDTGELPGASPTPSVGTGGDGGTDDDGAADDGATDDGATDDGADDGATTAGGSPVTGGGAIEGAATLPFTGGELVLGTLVGLGAVGAGTALVVAGRRRRTELA